MGKEISSASWYVLVVKNTMGFDADDEHSSANGSLHNRKYVYVLFEIIITVKHPLAAWSTGGTEPLSLLQHEHLPLLTLLRLESSYKTNYSPAQA